MLSAAKGERIAQGKIYSNVREELGAETLERPLPPAWAFGSMTGGGQAETDRYSEVPVIRRIPLNQKARERKSGEIPIKVFVSEPSKGETHGSIQRLQY